MTTAWFTKSPGDLASASLDDPACVMICADAPDWVRLPPQLGGARLRVLAAKLDACPMCHGAERVRHLACEQDYGVAECRRDGFVWYRSGQ